MTVVILVLSALIGLGFMLKLSCSGLAVRLATAAAAAMFIYLTADAAASQSKAALSSLLTDSAILLDALVLLTIDVALQLCYCFLAAGQTERKSRVAAALRLIPGPMVFGIMFLALVRLMLSLTGVDFQLIAALAAASVLLIVAVGSYLAARLMPRAEQRLEALYVVNMLILAFGMIAAVGGQPTAVATI